MRIRLYEDAMAYGLAQQLRLRGADVTTALDEGMIECEDSEHLEYATAQGRVLYSFNIGDYYKLHTEYSIQGKTHAGIILSQLQRYSIGEQPRRLLRIITLKTSEDMLNEIEFLSSWG